MIQIERPYHFSQQVFPSLTLLALESGTQIYTPMPRRYTKSIYYNCFTTDTPANRRIGRFITALILSLSLSRSRLIPTSPPYSIVIFFSRLHEPQVRRAYMQNEILFPKYVVIVYYTIARTNRVEDLYALSRPTPRLSLGHALTLRRRSVRE